MIYILAATVYISYTGILLYNLLYKSIQVSISEAFARLSKESKVQRMADQIAKNRGQLQKLQEGVSSKVVGCREEVVQCFSFDFKSRKGAQSSLSPSSFSC